MSEKSTPRVTNSATWRHPHPFTLHLKKLGAIAHAEIQTAPLVLLVGKNNTGKSYAASLLWAFMNVSSVLLASRARAYEVPRWFSQLWDFSEENASVTQFSAEDIENWLNEYIQPKSSNLLERLFSNGGVTAEEIRVEFNDPPALEIKPGFLAGTESGRASWSFDGDHDTIRFNLEISKGEDRTPLDLPFADLISKYLIGNPGLLMEGPVYIPAARTGLILAYQILVSELIGNLGGESSTAAKLPLPVIRFLQQLTLSHRTEGSFSDIADFVENSILLGEVTSGRGRIPDFGYKPQGSDENIPLYLTSSMVTELAPFTLLLRNGKLDHGVIFEEPDST